MASGVGNDRSNAILDINVVGASRFATGHFAADPESGAGPGCVKTFGADTLTQQYYRAYSQSETLVRLVGVERINLAPKFSENSFDTWRNSGIGWCPM